MTLNFIIDILLSETNYKYCNLFALYIVTHHTPLNELHTIFSM